ncbi:ATP synthase subunit delta, mitochondrial [Trichomonascus vanleenenianus]|uniref:F1F0 ATP synthase subunit delta n=1 Tax=Trichomonascus vanleenenianus TaxID=2268995 RepID=UPI003ECA7889
MFRAITSKAIRRPASLVLRRGYAEAAATTDKIKLSLALPRETLYENLEATQVNIPTTSGDLGILANHVPTIQQLRPGLIEVIDTTGTKQFFTSGGFATVNEGSTLEINAVEAYPLEDFSPEAVKSLTSEAQSKANSSDEVIATEGKIELEVLEALAAVAK